MEGSEWKEGRGDLAWSGLSYSPKLIPSLGASSGEWAGGQWTVPGATGLISAWLRYLGPENKIHWGREEGFIQKKR